MKPAFEKLLPPSGQSFRCFNRETINTAARWHRHPEIELTYVERGSGTRIVGDNIASYSSHDLVLIGPNVPHTWHSDDFEGSQLDLHPAIVVQFRRDFLGPQLFDAPELSTVRAMLDQASRGLKFDGETARRIGGFMNQLVVQGPAFKLVDMLKVLVELSESRAGDPLASIGFSSPPGSMLQTRTEEICNYIAENYRDAELTHQMLADKVEMNPSAFSRFFRATTGKTAMSYISEMRVSLACRLLADTDMGISEILTYAGFSNTSNFNRQFQRLQEMSPREYRKKHRAVSRTPKTVAEVEFEETPSLVNSIYR
ncbi:AraC family transcriptional regulator [Planctomicrobium sp. SH668]|uniref:AraC family transcriptional regulator n=1 Tax=Planctomicrobium sp. SH668 TaxID=3448126 RepID=UPI003F5C0DC9